MKHFFFSLKPRERFMALAALLVAATLWSTGAWERVQGGWDAWRLLEEDALAQKVTLAKEREVRNATTLAMATIRPSSSPKPSTPPAKPA